MKKEPSIKKVYLFSFTLALLFSILSCLINAVKQHIVWQHHSTLLPFVRDIPLSLLMLVLIGAMFIFAKRVSFSKFFKGTIYFYLFLCLILIGLIYFYKELDTNGIATLFKEDTHSGRVYAWLIGLMTPWPVFTFIFCAHLFSSYFFSLLIWGAIHQMIVTKKSTKHYPLILLLLSLPFSIPSLSNLLFPFIPYFSLLFPILIGVISLLGILFFFRKMETLTVQSIFFFLFIQNAYFHLPQEKRFFTLLTVQFLLAGIMKVAASFFPKLFLTFSSPLLFAAIGSTLLSLLLIPALRRVGNYSKLVE